MLKGIIHKGKRIEGYCKIENVINSGNKTETVICEGIKALSLDKIIFNCDNCKKETIIHKRIFFQNKKEFCSNCKTIQTSMKKYGVSSPNQSSKVKLKQHKTTLRTDYIDGKEFKKKTSNPEELSRLRSQITKIKWEKGDYNNVDYSSAMKKAWKDPIKRNNFLKGMSSKERRKKYSENTKNLWKRNDFREKMSNLSTRVSKFQKEVFEEVSLDNNWIIECPIEGTCLTVDMCNLKTKEIIECYGDYWHCNPKKYNKDLYHKRVRKSAQEIWSYDKERIDTLMNLGYSVKIIWESEWKLNKINSNLLVKTTL